MPDFSRFKNDKDGNSYCYDREEREVLRVRFEKVAIQTVPQEVLFELLKEESEREGD
jgi:hypothetical protein